MFPRLTVASAELAVLCRLDIGRVAITVTELRQVALLILGIKLQLCPVGILSVSHMHTARPPYSYVLTQQCYNIFKMKLKYKYRNSLPAITIVRLCVCDCLCVCVMVRDERSRMEEDADNYPYVNQRLSTKTYVYSNNQQ
jgi:hypothetical protein